MENKDIQKKTLQGIEVKYRIGQELFYAKGDFVRKSTVIGIKIDIDEKGTMVVYRFFNGDLVKQEYVFANREEFLSNLNAAIQKRLTAERESYIRQFDELQ